MSKHHCKLTSLANPMNSDKFMQVFPLYFTGCRFWSGKCVLKAWLVDSNTYTYTNYIVPTQGHLARYLAFHYGLRVTAVEAVGCHLKTAAKFDG